MQCTIEQFIDGAWRTAATVEALTNPTDGHQGGTRLSYTIDYAVNYLEEPRAAIACAYPVNFEIHVSQTWPPFLLDLLPQGAGRRRALADLELGGRDGARNDWPILLYAAGNPPGALRIGEAVVAVSEAHPGFHLREIIERREGFIEYARAHGASVAGSTGAQGDAPKFLLTIDRLGNWHADGALADEHAAGHWLMKLPRGKADSDRRILRNEAPYLEIARWFGLRVGEPLRFQEDTLFVPRFDRMVEGNRVRRFGLESLYSLAGVVGFGQSASHERLVDALACCIASDDLQEEITEYLLRDVLNVALRNTDNHGRNTAILKIDGRARLSPLYDFAPMFLDDEGIARVIRWSGDREHLDLPHWAKIVDRLASLEVNTTALRAVLAEKSESVRELPRVMEQVGIEMMIIEQLRPRIAEVAESLVVCR
ncbi:serine/threonine-protein kinase HipA [Gammaproteobacteria bacterium]